MLETRVLIVDRLEAARRQLAQPWPLRAYLFAFGLALILPAILFAALAINAFRSSDRAAQHHAALEIARAANNDLDRELLGMITTLRALATSEALEEGDFATFYQQAKRALRGGEANIVLRDLGNRQLLNTRVAWQTKLPVSGDPAPNPGRVARGEPWVSDFFVGAVARAPLYSVNLPVVLADGRKLVLNMSRPTESLVAILQGAGLPPSWQAGVADRNHLILARSTQHERFVGQPLASETLQKTQGAEGVWSTTNLTGERVLRAYTISRVSGWTAATWVPLDVVEAPYWRSLRLVLFAGAGLLMLSLVLAAGFGQMMARPIRDISEAAASLGRSENVPPLTAYPLHEANAVGAALHDAAKQLAERREALQRNEERIRLAHERLTLALDVTGLGTWDRDLVTDKIKWSEGMYQIFGRRPEEFSGTADEVLSFVHPDDRAAFRHAFKETVDGKSSGFGQEFRIVRPDGEVRWVLRRAQVIRSDDGRPASMLGVALDMTERRDKEEHVAFLMRELAHRSKNMVAVIQAIAYQTARHSDDVTDFMERFSARLVALSSTQDLLNGQQKDGAVLADLVDSQLAPFVERGGDRLRVSGPHVVLVPAATQSIGLALHELATNAAKYGALSVPQGGVSIEWRLVDQPEGAKALRIDWREQNGPNVAEPARKGFGHVVIERTLVDSLNAKVDMAFAPTGFTWELELPASHFRSYQRVPAA